EDGGGPLAPRRCGGRRRRQLGARDGRRAAGLRRDRRLRARVDAAEGAVAATTRLEAPRRARPAGRRGGGAGGLRGAGERGGACGEGHDERDFSCTLLAALVDEKAAVFFQIGDGAIVYRAEDGRYVPALWPQSGEYANCTFFLTDADATKRVQAARAGGVHEVALLTDGLQGLALQYASRAAHGPFFAPMFARLRGVTATRPRRLAGQLTAFL